MRDKVRPSDGFEKGKRKKRLGTLLVLVPVARECLPEGNGLPGMVSLNGVEW